MSFWYAFLSAIGCALCNGTAVVLQKVSADKQTRATSLHAGLFFRLLQDWPFVIGIGLDAVAWILTLVAVHSLPLFVVQPIIAISVVVSVVIESVLFHRKLHPQSMVAIGFIFAGLLLIALTAAPETATQVSRSVRLAVMGAPLLLAIIGGVFTRVESRHATIIIAALSGLAFGGTALAGRMLMFSPPYWHVFVSPLFIALLAYGLIGILLFTIALQRHHASVVNAVMITFETIAPIGIGLLVLGDRPKQGLWLVMVIGACVALTGTVLVAAKDSLESPLDKPALT